MKCLLEIKKKLIKIRTEAIFLIMQMFNQFPTSALVNGFKLE